MGPFQRDYTPLAVGAALLGVGCSITGAPLIRSLPETTSIPAFFLLIPLTIMLGIGSLVLNAHAWRTTQQSRYVVGLVISMLIFVILGINFSTPWLWPYATQ